MALLETWRKLAYETEMNQNQATEFWNSYFVQEKAIYEQILATPDAPVSGTVKELAYKFGVEVLMTYSYLNYYIMEYFFVNLIFKNLFLLHEKGQLCSLKLSCLTAIKLCIPPIIPCQP